MTAMPEQTEAVAVQVRYFAGARAAAGVPEETVRLSGPTTVSDVISAVLDLRGEGLAKVLPACSFLLDGVAVRDRGTTVPASATLDVLPPFAGG
ncbi:MoaD/ThiS family protein [Saccharopolyspora sp. WRP15-2]|uniref:MoaD/ThiS family protein n=1 Tax=Saccharopolyspora oryzae TaxID=2997343 RepID=A0ABT4V4A4_9PSEU|nr:MoaD/ThiS family protein [Saccharopolyspora oryzae]MDA3628127.1 MoaD/ThiS family protein [Saccharopolyspora oryzae]